MNRQRSFCSVFVIALVLSCLTVPVAFSAEVQTEELSFSLVKCIELALQNNLDIKAQRIDPEIKKLDYEIAKTLFDPVLSAEASKSVTHSPSVSFISPTSANSIVAGIRIDGKAVTGATYWASLGTNYADMTASYERFLNPSYDSALTLSLTQPLLRNFGKEATEYGIFVSKNNYDMSNAVFRQIVIDTVAQTEQGYWLLVGARDFLNVQKESLKLAQDQLEQSKIMVKVGTRAPIDVTQWEATVAQRNLDVINAENALKAAEDNLRAILNITPESPLWLASVIPTDRPSFEIVTVNLEESIKHALEKRPELEEAQINLKTLELTMRYQKNQRLPQLDFAGSYGLSGASGTAHLTIENPDPLPPTYITIPGDISGSYEQIRDADFPNYSVGLVFSVPIRNRAAAKQYLVSKLSYDKADLSYKSLEEQIAIEVKNAVRAVEMNIRKLDAAKASTMFSKEQLNAIEKKFVNGMATNLEVSTYQQQLAAAETDEIQALVAYNVALMSLEKAKGNLLESKEIILESSGQ